MYERAVARGGNCAKPPTVGLALAFTANSLPGRQVSPGPTWPACLVAGLAILVFVVAHGNDVGAGQPAVEVDILAARRAERIGLARRRPAAFGAGRVWAGAA